MATQIGTRVLPARFKDVTRWDLKPLKQHPCYTTTNNDYGRKVPQQAEMPLEWYGLDGSFTNGIPFMPSATGLQTAVMRSRVHTALD